MKLNLKIIVFLLIVGTIASCKDTTVKEKLKNPFQEMKDPTADTLSDWTKVPEGLNISFVSIDNKYPKSIAPKVEGVKTDKIVGWKGEILSAQFLLWTSEEIKDVEVKISNFNKDGTSLENIASAHFVRYVMTDIFEPGCGHRKPENFPASLTADMLDNVSTLDIEAKTTRPVWIKVSIPDNAQEGNYISTIEVSSKGVKLEELKLDLEVQNRVLPPAKDWGFHLDLWQHPSAVARVDSVELWSDEHFKRIKPVMQLLAGMGQKVITANINKDPWHNQCYDAYEDMIIWTRNEDSTWVYDYTIFDKWITFMMDEVGIKSMINCYSMIPWNEELHYKDASTDKFVTIRATPGTPKFEEMWTPFLKDFVQHLKEKDWLEITNIAMDERPAAMMKETMKLLEEVAPELGVSLADNHKSYKEYPNITDLCIAIEANIEDADLQMRKDSGLNTTYYVCCSHKFPNVFTFSAPSEAIYCSMHALAMDYDGFLRWAYNSWTENPLHDSRFRTWPAGDTYIVYPDARSSIRLERLREGIQDVEKVKILLSDLEKLDSMRAIADVDALKAEVSKFKNKNATQECSDMVNSLKTMINRLSK